MIVTEIIMKLDIVKGYILKGRGGGGGGDIPEKL